MRLPCKKSPSQILGTGLFEFEFAFEFEITSPPPRATGAHWQTGHGVHPTPAN